MKEETTWVLGPCSIENRENYFTAADELVRVMGGRDWYLKASFDKANRTSLHGGRGPGLEESLEIFREVKARHPGTRLCTDVHEVWQVEKLAGVIDCIQIPAFLCRQTDLVVECARHFDVVNIKKGQWLGPNNLVISVDKVRETNENAEVWITERGTMHGYHKLLVDFDIVDRLQQHYDKVIIDCTHSTQRSRDVYGIQGRGDLAERFLLGADVFQYNGIFAECHPNPSTAVSDGDCQIDLSRIEKLVAAHDRVKAALSGVWE